MTEPKYETIDLRLPKELRDRLCNRQLMAMLEAAWLDAFARGAEFGMELVRKAQEEIKAARAKKRRRKRK